MARYAFSDLHGHLELFKKIKEFVKPEDILYCLGDCGDRGPQSWETIKTVLEDPQVVYIKGNHEDMLIGAMYEVRGENEAAYPYRQNYCTNRVRHLLEYNGGYNTIQDWIDEGADINWARKLEELPVSIEITDAAHGRPMVLSHAGFSPHDTLPPASDFDLMWDRSHINDEDFSHNRELIVHGHTPCAYLDPRWNTYKKAVTYGFNSKIDIDMGTVNSYKVCLLNLDTLEEHYFSYLPRV